LSAIRIDPNDNVLVALAPLKAGERADGVLVSQDIPAAHKIAARAIRSGEPVIKYGYPIGVASCDIPAGTHVHVHNVRGSLDERVAEAPFASPTAAPDTTAPAQLSFDGYRRPDGRAATRNEIWIVNTVGCVNHASERIASLANRELAAELGKVDGVFAFPHPSAARSSAMT
jgi:altronate hydrolase